MLKRTPLDLKESFLTSPSMVIGGIQHSLKQMQAVVTEMSPSRERKELERYIQDVMSDLKKKPTPRIAGGIEHTLNQMFLVLKTLPASRDRRELQFYLKDIDKDIEHLNTLMRQR